MVSGILMAIFGAVGSLGMYCYISNDGQYTYTGHLTNHELAMIGIFVFFVLLLLTGVFSAIYSAVKKSNQDALRRLENMGAEGKPVGTCPSCGLNLAEGTLICPKCGYKIIEEGK